MSESWRLRAPMNEQSTRLCGSASAVCQCRSVRGCQCQCQCQPVSACVVRVCSLLVLAKWVAPCKHDDGGCEQYLFH
eukprot:15136659-Alexandrium_andersonii.AAC.1